MNRRLCIGLSLTIAMLAIAVWFTWTPISILYHKQGIVIADGKLQSLTKAQIAGAEIDYQSSRKWNARRKYHTDRLVALGYLFHASYELYGLPKSSFAKHRDAIMLRGTTTFPARPDRYWSISTSDEIGGNDTYHMVIDVYDLPEFKSQWDNFGTTLSELTSADRDVD